MVASSKPLKSGDVGVDARLSKLGSKADDGFQHVITLLFAVYKSSKAEHIYIQEVSL